MSAVIRSWDSSGRLVYRIRKDVIERLKNDQGQDRRGSDEMDYVIVRLGDAGDADADFVIIPKGIAEYFRGGGGTPTPNGKYRVYTHAVGPSDLIRNDNCGCEIIIQEFTG